MFNGLDQVDWKGLGYHTYQGQENIPEKIRNLLSPDAEVRLRARGFLLGSGQDFGDIYDTTPHIIPFLFDVLDSPDAPDRDQLLFHLSGVAEHVANPGNSSIHLMGLRLQTYDAFRAGLSILLALLDDPALEVCTASADLLGHMTDEVETLIPELARRFRAEHREEMQVALMFTLKRLLSSLSWWHLELKNPYTSFFKEVVETHPSHRVRVAAARASVEAISWYKGKQTGVSPQASVLLAQEFLEPSAPSNFMESESSSYHAEMIARDLSRLDPEPLLELLENPDIDAEQAHLLARALLANVFLFGTSIEAHWRNFPDFSRKKEGMFYSHPHAVLNTLQTAHKSKQRFLQAIIDSEKVWETPTDLFSQFYGLPDSREALQELLKVTSAA